MLWGKDLAGFQKPLFWTPDITPYPSPVSLLSDIFVEPKTASREPCQSKLFSRQNLLPKNTKKKFGGKKI
jgi:hypothetical protein